MSAFRGFSIMASELAPVYGDFRAEGFGKGNDRGDNAGHRG
jgi:hypothetical protein